LIPVASTVNGGEQLVFGTPAGSGRAGLAAILLLLGLDAAFVGDVIVARS
jgi:hypothetical protein